MSTLTILKFPHRKPVPSTLARKLEHLAIVRPVAVRFIEELVDRFLLGKAGVRPTEGGAR